MLNNNKQFQLKYLTFLQESFINSFEIEECEELLKEISSLNIPSLEMQHVERCRGIKISQFVNGTNPLPFLSEVNPISDLSEYKDSIKFGVYAWRLKFFAERRNEDARDILNKISKDFPNRMNYYTNTMEECLKLISNNGSDVLLVHKKLYELFNLYKKNDDAISYNNLANFFNENIEHWNKYLVQPEKTPKDIYGVPIDKFDGLNLKSWEALYIREVQEKIGEAVFLQFMASPNKYLEFTQRMPDLLDFFHWFNKSNWQNLSPFLEQTHIDIMSKIENKEEKNNFINTIFDVEKHVDSKVGDYYLDESKLNIIFHLIKKIDFNPMFDNNSHKLGKNLSLCEFYSNKKSMRGHNDSYKKMYKENLEQIELVENRFAQLILNNNLQRDLETNNSKHKNRLKI